MTVTNNARVQFRDVAHYVDEMSGRFAQRKRLHGH